MSFKDVLDEIDVILQPSTKPLSEGKRKTLQDHLDILRPFVYEKGSNKGYMANPFNKAHFDRVCKVIMETELMLSVKRDE